MALEYWIYITDPLQWYQNWNTCHLIKSINYKGVILIVKCIEFAFACFDVCVDIFCFYWNQEGIVAYENKWSRLYFDWKFLSVLSKTMWGIGFV